MTKKTKKKICGRGPSKAKNKNSKIRKLLAWIKANKKVKKRNKIKRVKKVTKIKRKSRKR